MSFFYFSGLISETKKKMIQIYTKHSSRRLMNLFIFVRVYFIQLIHFHNVIVYMAIFWICEYNKSLLIISAIQFNWNNLLECFFYVTSSFLVRSIWTVAVTLCLIVIEQALKTRLAITEIVNRLLKCECRVFSFGVCLFIMIPAVGMVWLFEYFTCFGIFCSFWHLIDSVLICLRWLALRKLDKIKFGF